ALQPRDRPGVDDHAALAHVLQRELRHPDVREDVRAERLLELLGREVRDVPGLPLERGVVDQDVQPAELRGRALDDVATVLAVAEVAVERERAATGLADPAHGLARVVVLVVVGDRHVGPLAGERDGDGATDAAVAAGDQGSATLELARTPVALFTVIRRRPQLGLRARPLLLLPSRPAARPLLRQRVHAHVQAVPALLGHDDLPPAVWPR